ncbi:class I SAM-dependent methyltransferase [Engelhardtia mirabilis]|uniref:Erythromycin 3''-O-methyltransferase n=1 Tax=Engelhardtia mirabilis TaxID=2528011 RepID=A0A518BJT1_9BACT|nr:Erythromycin 3''-O-methyltransferase [Planctomycetes bacterium Pla133]QDV01559.1 Erythromycin 3''-O-methyltransferase [Planctomycetes bacterium Pla86]
MPAVSAPIDLDWSPILADLGLPADALEGSRAAAADTASLALSSRSGASGILAEAKSSLGAAGAVLLVLEGQPDDAELARWRNDLWPLLHVVAIYELGDPLVRRSLQGRTKLGACPGSGTVMAMRRVSHVMSPEATREKFDQNASGWNGEPGGPGYPHFRWMRKLVGKFAPAADGQRIIDFGCGAGWVGIEAAAGHKNIALAAFDPSPEMVKIAAANAAKEGVTDFTGRVGFGEAPPFPAEGEEPFDLVISSGVVSFSPDFEAWMRGLVRCCKPGGTLVVGDINPDSRGFHRRRGAKPILPIRELNGRRPSELRTWLEARGFVHKQTVGYQATWPMPQIMQVNETKLGGLLSHPLVWANAGLTAIDRMSGNGLASQFDSWVMEFDVPTGWDPSTLG